jgi:hypothetical protein
MSIMDTLWPWKALRELRIENRAYLLRYADDLLEVDSLRARIKNLENDVVAKDLRIKFQKDEIMRLNEKMKTAIFRDPKTGRIAKLSKKP